MKPASTTRSGSPRRSTRASAASKARASAKRLWSTTVVAMPCWRAMLEAAGVGRLLITCVTAPANAALRRCVGEQRAEVGAAARDQDGDAWQRHACRDVRRAGLRVRRRRRRSAPRRLARHDGADAMHGLARGGEQRGSARSACSGATTTHHADAAVEHAVHLGLGDVAGALQPGEQRGPRPARARRGAPARRRAARAARSR